MASAYPPAYWDELKRIRRGSLWALAITGAPAALFAVLAIQPWAKAGLVFLAALSSAVFAFVSMTAIFGGIDVRQARIVPYFQRDVEGPFMLTHGEALARNCLRLDALAESRGCAPPSSFGFADDLAGETVVWHSATEGLRTMSTLIAEVEAWPEAVDHPASVLDDLRLLEARLEHAASQQVAFAVLLRHGNTISGHEVDVRRGKF